MDPFSPAFVPGFTHQRSQSMAVPKSNNTTPLASTDPISAGPHSVPTPVMMHSRPRDMTSPGEQALAVQPQPATMAQLAYGPRQPEIVSPVSQRTTLSLLQQLEQLDLDDTPDTSKTISAYRQSADKVTQPSEMPIGSLVHAKEPPKWGVIKISNIPYSITKQEIIQFLGRQARLITSDKGYPVHIIMERSTAKTMECYVEFETPSDARDTVVRINRIYETGRAPRLGNRHVDIEWSGQDALLKDLFPRAKCVVWKDGMPYVMPNNDPYSTGFTGFFTSEEIIGAIRHAEIPHRSPFCDKCPQRTYESTISTLYKFPWYAPRLYTVHDRNQLFELANRHVMSLVSRVRRTNTVGLDQKLLHDLLQAGLNCPAFNERQKYTLCMNSEITTEIMKFPALGKWFPFDALVRMPNFHEDIHMYYANLISQGSVPRIGNLDLPNLFPMDNPHIRSPYGRIWFEWPAPDSKDIAWETAVHHEMVILSSLVLSGWINDDMNCLPNIRRDPAESSFSLAPGTRTDMSGSYKGHRRTESSSHYDVFSPPSRRASESLGYAGHNLNNTGRVWNQRLLLNPPGRSRPAYLCHRNTVSSPTCLPSPSTNPPWATESSE